MYKISCNSSSIILTIISGDLFLMIRETDRISYAECPLSRTATI